MANLNVICADCEWHGTDADLINPNGFGRERYVDGENCPKCESDNVPCSMVCPQCKTVVSEEEIDWATKVCKECKIKNRYEAYPELRERT